MTLDNKSGMGAQADGTDGVLQQERQKVLDRSPTYLKVEQIRTQGLQFFKKIAALALFPQNQADKLIHTAKKRGGLDDILYSLVLMNHANIQLSEILVGKVYDDSTPTMTLVDHNAKQRFLNATASKEAYTFPRLRCVIEMDTIVLTLPNYILAINQIILAKKKLRSRRIFYSNSHNY